MPDLAREAAMAHVLEVYLPKDYNPRAVAEPFIAEMHKQGLDVTFKNATVDQVREEGYQEGQRDARKHFAELAFDGLDAHQWDQPTGTCSCGWMPSNKRGKAGAAPGTAWTQWRQHAGDELAGLAQR